jgi:hypothetical protein
MKTSLNLDGMNGLLFRISPDVIQWLVLIIAVAQLIVAFALAFAVSADAEKKKDGLFLVGPWMWFFVVLLTGGYLGTLGYWLIHYSSLRLRHEKS